MPLLFPGPAMSPAYVAARTTMVTWIQGLLNCTPGNVTQCLNGIENTPANPGGGVGVTALRVRIVGGHGTSIPVNPNPPLLPVYHVSHGVVGVGSCSLFWIVQPQGSYAKIVGVAEHATNVTYAFAWVAGAEFLFSRTNNGPLPVAGAAAISPF